MQAAALAGAGPDQPGDDLSEVALAVGTGGERDAGERQARQISVRLFIRFLSARLAQAPG